MCQIVCQSCNEVIGEDAVLYQVRMGFVEKGDFIPEEEIAYYHVNCYPLRDDQPDDILIITV